MRRDTVPRTIALMLESDGPGGAERLLLLMAEELRQRGYEVCPVGPVDGSGWLAGEFRARGFEPETFSNTSMIDWRCVRGLMELFDRREIDLVHSHEFTMAVYGAAACRLSRRGHVVTMHGGKYYATKWRRRQVSRWALRRSVPVAVSAATRNHLTRSLRLAPDSVRVIYNGIRFSPGTRSRLREELAVGSNEALIVAIGNLYGVKGHKHLLEAVHRIRVRQPKLPWRLAIAGRGEERDELVGLAAQLGLSTRVHFLGFRPDVADILAAADVYAMPSLSEGLPLALLEAMFARKAIVASNVGGIPEVVRESESALLAPPGDPERLSLVLQRLLEDRGLRDRLAEAASRRANERFSVEKMMDSYEQLYSGAYGAAST
jgi:glycosyltransferase involved in cell wall biosynthesis